jgi:hypothetical protein
MKRTPADYRSVHEAFAAVLPEATSTPIQTDLAVAFSGTLGTGVLRDVELFTDYAARMGNRTTMQRLHDSFLERYEGVERMVPLLELVDENLGIPIPEAPNRSDRDVTARDALLFRIAGDAARTCAQEVVLDEATMDAIAPPLPPDEPVFASSEVGFAIAAASAQAVEAGDYLVVPGGYRFSDGANKSLGRFAHTFDPGTIECMRTIARQSETPGTIVAEFVFAPREDRAFNVVTRPSLCDVELRIGVGQAAAEATLPVDDLWIGIENGRFFLWSQALQSRIDVQETHAFATAFRAPDICRLLTYLRYDGARTLDEFDWGAADGSTYLPRVRIGRIVLSLRRWKFAAAGFDLALERTRWNIPRFVHLAEDDRRMLLDLDSPIAAALIADQTGQRPYLTFKEALPLPETEWVRGTGGAHATEFVAQAIRAHKPARTALATPSISTNRVTYGPGSKWIYAKLYCGRQTTGHLLQTRVEPLVAVLKADAAIDRWFFVRYGDPHSHLRLRFRAMPGRESDVREAVCAASESWLQDGTLSRVAFETYSPEYERYGGAAAIEASEAFFTADSDAALDVLRAGSRSTDGIVAAAAASFDGYLQSEDMTSIVLSALGDLAKQKLPAADREVLKAMSPAPATGAALAAFDAALGDVGIEKRLCDLIHMHCNRLGVDYEAETRVYGLLRAMALRRAAQKKEREPQYSGSRS